MDSVVMVHPPTPSGFSLHFLWLSLVFLAESAGCFHWVPFLCVTLFVMFAATRTTAIRTELPLRWSYHSYQQASNYRTVHSLRNKNCPFCYHMVLQSVLASIGLTYTCNAVCREQNFICCGRKVAQKSLKI